MEFGTGAEGGNLSVIQAEAGWQPGYGTTLVLNVADSHSSVAELRGKGVRCDDLELFPGFVTFASFYEPFGNRIQMCSPADRRARHLAMELTYGRNNYAKISK